MSRRIIDARYEPVCITTLGVEPPSRPRPLPVRYAPEPPPRRGVAVAATVAGAVVTIAGVGFALGLLAS